MKVLSIGDIHGRDSWKRVIDSSGPVDHVVFIGDYVDSHEDEITNVVILHNLKEIIELKRSDPSRVTLIIGNHDVQYMRPSQRRQYSGYRSEAYWDLHDLFKQNDSLFDPVYELESSSGVKHIWTHAGICREWVKSTIKVLRSDDIRLGQIWERVEDPTPSETVLLAWQYGLSAFYDASWHNGGTAWCDSPIWTRPKRLDLDGISDAVQIVGHTCQTRIKSVELPKNRTNHYIDVLAYQEVGLILDIS